MAGRLAGALVAGRQGGHHRGRRHPGRPPRWRQPRWFGPLGAEPVLILPVVDRGGTCGAMAAAAGIPFHALVTAPDLGFPYEKDA